MADKRTRSTEMSVIDHLTELRDRLIKSVAAIAVGGVVAFVLYPRILDILIDPYCQILPPDRACTLIITDPLEGFRVRLQIAGYGGLILALPVVLWQVWRFITPGLHPKEKRYAIPFIISSIILFLLGAGLALWTFPKALEFLVSIGGGQLETLFSPGNYLSLVTFMMLAFGAGFEFPIVLVFLQLAGILPTRKLREWRRIAIVLIVTLVAVVTPSGDPYTLFALSVPMYVFYEASILVGRFLKK